MSISWFQIFPLYFFGISFVYLEFEAQFGFSIFLLGFHENLIRHTPKPPWITIILDIPHLGSCGTPYPGTTSTVFFLYKFLFYNIWNYCFDFVSLSSESPTCWHGAISYYPTGIVSLTSPHFCHSIWYLLAHFQSQINRIQEIESVVQVAELCLSTLKISWWNVWKYNYFYFPRKYFRCYHLMEN